MLLYCVFLVCSDISLKQKILQKNPQFLLEESLAKRLHSVH